VSWLLLLVWFGRVRGIEVCPGGAHFDHMLGAGALEFAEFGAGLGCSAAFGLSGVWTDLGLNCFWSKMNGVSSDPC
jgi:hypothetical protein